MAETWMANDISYSGTKQGYFMPNLVLFSPSEIFYQLSAPLYIPINSIWSSLDNEYFLWFKYSWFEYFWT